MDLYLVPNNPEHTVFVSPNGVAHYQVQTYKAASFREPRISRIQRPAESLEESIIGDIEWKTWGTPAVIHSSLLDGSDSGVKVQDFLYRKHQFSSTRYFVGNDLQEYRWKIIEKGQGMALSRSNDNQEIARYSHGLCGEGIFFNQRKSCLSIYADTDIDIDLIVLSFTIMEKKRRDSAGDDYGIPLHDHDPHGDGGDAAGGMDGGGVGAG